MNKPDTIFNKGGSVAVEVTSQPEIGDAERAGGCNTRKDGLVPHFDGDDGKAYLVSGYGTDDLNKPFSLEPPVASALSRGIRFLAEHEDTPLAKPRMPIEQTLEALFDHLGEDKSREGLQETPSRWRKAWQVWGAGYEQDPNDFMKTFEERQYDEMVLVKDIPIYSHCEHHLAAIFGTATIAYIPDGRVLGLSKLSRVADVFARRLQVQERLTVQIADAIFNSELKPKGVGVILNCRHMCMESRGIQKQGATTTTSALRGVLTQGDPRAEFLRLAI